MTDGFPAQPIPGTPRAYHFPHTTRRRLDTGTRVIIASLPKVPLVTVTVVLHGAGADSDPAGREGLAQLTAATLQEGTSTMDAAALAEYFEGLGSALTAVAEWEATVVNLSVQPARLDNAVNALKDVLRAPAFPEHELHRLRAEHRAARMQLVADPRALANAAFAWRCYDERARYRRPLDGTLASVDAITRDNIVHFWRTRYAASAMTIVVAGDISADRGVLVAESLTSGWTTPAPSANAIVADPREWTSTLALVEKADAAQAEIRVGHIGVPRTHADYFPLTVMNAILGGLFSSRINLNLRERHGYTYGASSGFDWRAGAGPWLANSAVKTEVTTAAIREILSEVEQIRATLVGIDELELATNYLIGVFPLRYETTSAVSAALASQAVFELPDDYFDSYRDHIAAVTPEDVRRVAAAHLHPDRFQIVVVGTPELRAGLVELGPGAVHVHSADEIEVAR